MRTQLTNPLLRSRKQATWLWAMVIIFCYTDVYSQQRPNDTPGNAYIETLTKSYQSQNEAFLSTLKTVTDDKKLLKHYESSYKTVFKTLNERIKDGEMIYIPSISTALEKILADIKTANPAVPADIKVYLLRSGMPNAYTFGDNNLLVNLGLLDYLETEDQVAGVLAHEVGHLLMTHTLKALAYSYARNKESAADVSTVRHTELKKADLAFDLWKNALYKGEKMARYHELQADSVAMVLIKNTRYQKAAFIDALAIIEPFDTLRLDGLSNDIYKHFFDLPRQKFQERWMNMEDFSSYNYSSFTEKFNKDSLSSHPKVKERITYLKRIFPDLLVQEKAGKANLPDTFNKLRSIARAERIPNLFFKEEYGEVIYISLVQLQQHPNDTPSRVWLARGFEKIYEGRRDYQLNRYLDRIAPQDQTPSYMQFLSFMWNLKLEEIKNIAEYYSGKTMAAAQ